MLYQKDTWSHPTVPRPRSLRLCLAPCCPHPLPPPPRLHPPDARPLPPGQVVLPEGTAMVMPGDNFRASVELSAPVALEVGGGGGAGGVAAACGCPGDWRSLGHQDRTATAEMWQRGAREVPDT